MTAALLLARQGHEIVIYERGQLGGLWACALDEQGQYRGENSCKVYQASYQSAPALFRMIGTRWEEHFVARHDLREHWLRPFVRDCSWTDLARFAGAFFLHRTRLYDYRQVSAAEWTEQAGMSEACKAWMRATALGGIAGTLRMTMWELFHRIEGNLGSILGKAEGVLYWNKQPPNSASGFVSQWRGELERHGVEIRPLAVDRLACDGELVRIVAGGVEIDPVDAVFLAVPPRALARLLLASDPPIVQGFGRSPEALAAMLDESLYEHLGVVFHFDKPLPADLPLGGHNVRRNWHPILVQHSQYQPHLPAPEVTVVSGSVSLDTEFLHARLGTRAKDHTPESVAAILWEDERAVDPTLPEPTSTHVYGMSDATQVIRHGPLPVKAKEHPVFIATSMNGLAPYFTASLESAIQAGSAAAAAFDTRVALALSADFPPNGGAGGVQGEAPPPTRRKPRLYGVA